MATFIQISKFSRDWFKIENLLQVALGTSTASIKRLQSIAQPQMNLEFERRLEKKNMVSVPVFIDTSELTEDETPEIIANNGFDLLITGRKITTGFLQLQKHKENRYQLILCKVAIGKSLVLNENEYNTSYNRKTLDPYFDSIYLKPDDDDIFSSTYKFDYIVFDNGQIHPEYLVEFEFDETRKTKFTVSLDF